MSDNALDVLAARLALVEERLARLEAAHLGHAQPDLLNRATPPQPAEPVSPIDATLIGKSVLIIGGGYLFRALTEMGVLAQSAGIALGLVYALFWMFVADRAMKRGQTNVALFDATTAALIAASLMWESTTRFHLLSSAVASLLVVLVAFALLAIAWRQHSPAIALIAVVMASVTSIGIAIGTAQLVAPVCAVAVIGLAVSAFDWPVYIPSIIAASNDSLALPLVVMTMMAPRDARLVQIALIALAVLWLVVPAIKREVAWPQLGQAVIATLIGLGGAALVGHGTIVPAACLAIAALSYAAAFLRARDDAAIVLAIAGAVALAIGTYLLLQPFALAIVWAAAAATSSLIARRRSWYSMNVQAACWALAAAMAAGLPQAIVSASKPSPAVVIVGVVAAIALWSAPSQSHRSRLVLLAIVTLTAIVVMVGGLSNLMTSRAILAMTRTAALSIAAIVLAGMGSRVDEARSLARILLVAGGAKLLLEDLSAGRAVTIVVALALYGGAIVIVARARSSVALP
ncbi:MAG: hypothetical protein ACXW2Q_14355 [Thermoanaerobaculia bacterium]